MDSEDLHGILACPLCRGNVEEKKGNLVCRECGRLYPVRDNIPAMLADEPDWPGKESQ